MFNIGGGEALVILLVALIILGPERLPQAARQMGQWATELRRMSGGFQDELKSAIDIPDDVRADLKSVINTPRQIRQEISQTLTGGSVGGTKAANRPATQPGSGDEPIVKPGEYQAAEQPTMRAGDDVEAAAAEATEAGRQDVTEQPPGQGPSATEGS
ncbi:MAG: twin-arginine translocase subunit TatB [Actinomycetia bacterium]|nr:twin-arginine translocase subunit TatB [Actinomycetes bacterium]MCP4083751.1 twin-arginine translocase subunit TatB [Actinomycetes bacterium]